MYQLFAYYPDQLPMSVISQKKPTTLGNHHIKGFHDQSTKAREKWGVKCHTNLWTPCRYDWFFYSIYFQKIHKIDYSTIESKSKYKIWWIFGFITSPNPILPTFAGYQVAIQAPLTAADCQKLRGREKRDSAKEKLEDEWEKAWQRFAKRRGR